MATFRNRDADESDESANESGEDDAMMNRILSNRPKAVPKRRFKTDQNNGGSSALETVKEEQTDEVGESKMEEDKDKKVASSAGKLWAETAMMQTLEEKIATGSSATIHNLRDRGSETYALDLGKNKKFDLSTRKRRRPDDISDSIWDEPMEEKKIDGLADADKLKQDKESTVEATFSDPVADLWDGVDTGAVELPIERQPKQWHGRGGHFKRFRQDFSHQRGQAKRGRGRGGGGSFKPFKKEFMAPEKFLPKRLIAPDYDEEKLFNKEIDPDALDEDQIAKELVEALGEKIPEVIHKAVEYAGKHRAVGLFKECQEVEKRGGMLTKREDRRKAPGGVFLQLFNQHPDIPDEHKKALFALGQEMMKKHGLLQPFWIKKKQREKQQKMEKAVSPPPDIENDDLPKCTDLFKPDCGAGNGDGQAVDKQEMPVDTSNEPMA